MKQTYKITHIDRFTNTITLVLVDDTAEGQQKETLSVIQTRTKSYKEGEIVLYDHEKKRISKYKPAHLRKPIFSPEEEISVNQKKKNKSIKNITNANPTNKSLVGWL